MTSSRVNLSSDTAVVLSELKDKLSGGFCRSLAVGWGNAGSTFPGFASRADAAGAVLPAHEVGGLLMSQIMLLSIWGQTLSFMEYYDTVTLGHSCSRNCRHSVEKWMPCLHRADVLCVCLYV